MFVLFCKGFLLEADKTTPWTIDRQQPEHWAKTAQKLARNRLDTDSILLIKQADRQTLRQAEGRTHDCMLFSALFAIVILHSDSAQNKPYVIWIYLWKVKETITDRQTDGRTGQHKTGQDRTGEDRIDRQITPSFPWCTTRKAWQNLPNGKHMPKRQTKRQTGRRNGHLLYPLLCAVV